ncbi:hypothetical protein HELRODRAFT_170057 [Helobdella robusta]|uniref:Uncharacterized protein n=1 Tax=Helobdella robusta TaxID=6412 RepID=T1F2L3_HELRO|nr:hypothetical protein HELRODRAFT_170057 [Helobdella robusta]ESO07517.1 hypothetical protein HELRODRAFT_170057 [Helobdella robusta]
MTTINREFCYQSKIHEPPFSPNRNSDDDDASSNILLIKNKKQLNSNGNISFFGIIKAGKKCVKVNKTPKTRKGFEGMVADVPDQVDSVNLPTFDRIEWCDEIISLEELVSRSTPFPVIIKVMNVKPWKNIQSGQCLMLHQSGIEQRVLLQDLKTKDLFSISRESKLQIRRKVDGTEINLEDVFSTRKPSDEVIVMINNVNAVEKDDILAGREIILKQLVSSTYVVCSSISAGWIDQSQLKILPCTSDITVKLASRLRAGGVDEWDDYISSLSRSVRHRLIDGIRGYEEILVEHIEHSTTNRSYTYENVQIINDQSTIHEKVAVKDSNKLRMYENVYISNTDTSQIVHTSNIDQVNGLNGNNDKDKFDHSHDSKNQGNSDRLCYTSVIYSNSSRPDATLKPSKVKPTTPTQSQSSTVTSPIPASKTKEKPQILPKKTKPVLKIPSKSSSKLVQASSNNRLHPEYQAGLTKVDTPSHKPRGEPSRPETKQIIKSKPTSSKQPSPFKDLKNH